MCYWEDRHLFSFEGKIIGYVAQWLVIRIMRAVSRLWTSCRLLTSCSRKSDFYCVITLNGNKLWMYPGRPTTKGPLRSCHTSPRTGMTSRMYIRNVPTAYWLTVRGNGQSVFRIWLKIFGEPKLSWTRRAQLSDEAKHFDFRHKTRNTYLCVLHNFSNITHLWT
jgi:hypothetical protein